MEVGRLGVDDVLFASCKRTAVSFVKRMMRVPLACIPYLPVGTLCSRSVSDKSLEVATKLIKAGARLPLVLFTSCGFAVGIN